MSHPKTRFNPPANLASPAVHSDKLTDAEEPEAVSSTAALPKALVAYQRYMKNVAASATRLQDSLNRKAGLDKELHPGVRFEPLADPCQEAEAVLLSNKDSLAPPSHRKYMAMWKICLQYGQCTPFEIIGVNRSLQAEKAAPGPNGLEPHMWTASFCLALANLVPHPAWPTNYTGALAQSLATVIQYAVILRTNDQRAWDPAQGRLDPFLMALRERSAARAGTYTTMAEVHAEVRRSLNAQGYAVPAGSLSSIFLELEKLITIPDEVLESGEMYSVRTGDLGNIETALDNLHGDTTGNRYLPTKTYYESALEARRFHPKPHAGDVPIYHRLAMLEECRRSLRMTTSAASGRETPPSGQQEQATRPDGRDKESGSNDSAKVPLSSHRSESLFVGDLDETSWFPEPDTVATDMPSISPKIGKRQAGRLEPAPLRLDSEDATPATRAPRGRGRRASSASSHDGESVKRQQLCAGVSAGVSTNETRKDADSIASLSTTRPSNKSASIKRHHRPSDLAMGSPVGSTAGPFTSVPRDDGESVEQRPLHSVRFIQPLHAATDSSSRNTSGAAQLDRHRLAAPDSHPLKLVWGRSVIVPSATDFGIGTNYSVRDASVAAADWSEDQVAARQELEDKDYTASIFFS